MNEPRRGIGFGGLLAVLLVAGLVVAAAGVFPFRQILAQRQSADLAEAQLEALQEENMRLEQQVAALRTPQEVERLAREQFGLVRPGEISYVAIVPEGTDVDEPEIPDSGFSEEEAVPWWEKLWGFLTGDDLIEDG